MTAIVNWMVDNWGLICGGAVLAVSLLNVVTRHYSQATGVGRFALLAIDLLSFLTSGGNKPVVKVPIVTVSKPDIFDNYAARIKAIREERERLQCKDKSSPPSP